VADKGDKTLTLAAVTGLVFRKSYLITNTKNQQEWVRVMGWDATSKVADLDEPLEFDHAVASTLQGTGFYRTLSAAEVANLQEGWRIRCTYTSGGFNYLQDVNFDIVLTPLVSPLTAELLKRLHPDIMPREHAQTRGTEYADLRERAWSRVLTAIRAQGRRPALVRTGEGFDEWALAEFDLIAYKAGVKAVFKGTDPSEAIRELKEDRNTAKLTALGGMLYDEGEDDSIGSTDEQPQKFDMGR
jgi:hypothetical protein